MSVPPSPAPLRTPIVPTALAVPTCGAVPRTSCPRPRALPPSSAPGLRVPTLHGDACDYANLDHAASTPALETVKAAVDRALETYSSRAPRRRLRLAGLTSAWYEQARDEVARLRRRARGRLGRLHPQHDRLVNLLGRACRAARRSFVFDTEHHATLLPWDRLRTVRLPVPGSVEDAHGAARGGARRHHPSRHRLVVVAGRLQRHRRGVAGRAARRARPRGTAPGSPSTPPSSSAHRRIDLAALGRRLRRLLRPQDLRPVRRRRAGRPRRLARRRAALPARRRRDRGR